MRRVIIGVLIVAVIVAMTFWPDRSGLAPAPPEPTTDRETGETGGVEVVEVLDGDSIVLRIDGVAVESRLRGVNAIELFECGGREAKDALEQLVAVGVVDVSGDQLDRFDRLLVDLDVDGVDVNAALVEAGWALGYHADGRYVAATEAAADAGVGWWGLDCDPGFTGVFRLGFVDVDPAGPDGEHLNGEQVEIVNRGVEPASLAGWVVRDETTGHVFEMPAIDVPPGGSVTVRSGSGTDDADEVFLGERSPVWSNRGETVLLLDPSGTVADVRFHG